MAINLESINRRVGAMTGQSPSETELDFDKVRADFSAFTASKVGSVKPAVEKRTSSVLDEVKAIGSDIARGAINNVAASSLEAFGQFDKADELRQYSESQFGRTGQAPVFGEMPGGRFIKESIFENAPQLAASAALLAIPVAGPALAVASIFLPLYGESRREVLDGTGKDQALAALTPAVFNTAIELNPVGKIANRFGLKNPFANAMKQQILADKKSGIFDRVKDIGAFSGEIAIKEGLIEVAQNASNLATVRFLTDEAVLSKLTPEQKNEMWAGFWGGLSAGGAIGAVSAGYSQYRGDVYLKDRQKEAESDERILNALQSRKAGNDPGKPAMTQEEAAKQVIANALPVTAPEATETGTNAQAAPVEVPPAAPVTSLADLLTEQEIQLVDQILSMPEVDQAIAILSGEERLAQVKQEIAFLENQFQQAIDPMEDVIGTYEQLDTHAALSKGLTRDAMPIGEVRANKQKFLDKLTTAYAEKDGQLIESSLAYTADKDIDVNSGLVIATDAMSKTTVDQVQTAKLAWEVLGKLGLQTNPITGEPFRLIVTPTNQASSHASIIDSTTLWVAPSTVEQTGEPGFASNLFHELSHLVTGIVQGSMAATERSVLYKAWVKALSESATKSDYYSQYAPSYINAYEKIPFSASPFAASYKQSLPEFLAESFRTSFLNLAEADAFNLKTELPAAFKELNKSYRQIQAIAKREGLPMGEGSFRDFIKLRLLRRELVELEAANAVRERDAKAGKRAQKELKDIEVSQGKIYTNRLSDLKANGPADDVDHTILMLDKAGFSKDAANVLDVKDINMGFLGNNLRGAAARKMLTPLQIAEQAEARGFSFPSRYMELVQQFQATKMRIIERADTALREWRALGTKEANNVSRMLYLVSTKSDELGRRLTPEELAQIQAGVGLSAEGLAEWDKIDKLFLQTVSDIEAGMVYDAAKTYIEDRALAKEFRDKYMTASKEEREALIEQYTGKPLLDLSSGDSLTNPLWDVLESIKGQTDGMRNKNYFPRARLGEYAVRIYAVESGIEWEGATSTKENETLGFYAFDTEAEQKAFVAEMASSMGNGLRSYAYKMDSEVFAVMGLPAGIIEQVKRELPNLTQKQREQLDDIAMQRSPGRRFLRHLTKRRGIAGYSEDAMRVFANYLTSSANHLARTEHASDLAKSISGMEAAIKETPGDSVVVNDLNVIKDYFVKHFDYLMKPDNDWARLRAVGFLWYLGFNVKSAAVNFMQTPMVTYPVLAKHTSDGNAVRRIAGAMKDATAIMTGRATLTEGEAAAIQELIEAGIIDESMVSELAGMAEGNALQRLVPGMDLKSTLDKFAWAGGWGFRIGEKYNRYVAGLAAYRVAKDNKLSQEDAVKFARDTVQASQFEYSRWNRAEFMRGKKSVLFLFWQYMQHASYLAFGGKGSATATRMWMLALLIAGIEGLPFAEMILNIFDFSGTQIKKMLGHPNPRVALREDLRELILNIHDRPDDILKGMSYQWGLGPLHAASLLGIPVPQISTRGSLSYGNPVQWFDGIMDPTVSDKEKMLAQSIAAVAGPVGGIALGGIEAMTSKDPDAWKRWEKILPVFMKSASQGIRWSVRGEETSSDQSTLLTFETPEQRAELVLKSLGFQPTRVDQKRQQLRATQVPVLYLQARQAALLKQLDYAVLTKNREGRKDVLDAIKAYNDNLAKSKIYAPLMIKSETISNSLRGRIQRRAEKAAGIEQGPNAILIQKANERLYPITSGE